MAIQSAGRSLPGLGSRRRLLGVGIAAGCAAVFDSFGSVAYPPYHGAVAFAMESSMPVPKLLMSGIALGESPRWHDNRLWFADWGMQEIIAVDLDGNSEVIGPAPSVPCSLGWLPDGQLLILAGSEGQLLRRESDGSLATHADLTALAATPWNDIVVDGRGNTYLGNIGFDFPEGEFAPGIIAVVSPDGSARQVADGLAFANGMAVSPDNATLIVAESYGTTLTAFDIDANGDLSRRRVWADLGDGVPDGICLDAENAVWYGDVPNQRCVRVRESGEVLATIEIDRGCFACMLGGPDRRTLFLLAADWSGGEEGGDGELTGQVLTVPAAVAGAGWP